MTVVCPNCQKFISTFRDEIAQTDLGFLCKLCNNKFIIYGYSPNVYGSMLANTLKMERIPDLIESFKDSKNPDKRKVASQLKKIYKKWLYEYAFWELMIR